jgi:Arc/MetJ-type ribon-helix-helix transcriptional regulator
MTQVQTEKMTFRLDKHLCDTIRIFAKKNGYENTSELIRQIVVFHFMSITLGYSEEMSKDEAENEIKRKLKEYYKKEREKL